MALVALMCTDRSTALPCSGSYSVMGSVVSHQNSCVEILPYNGSLFGDSVFEERVNSDDVKGHRGGVCSSMRGV